MNSLFGWTIIEMPFPRVRVQARIHPRKKRRLQKKWAKRYGYKYIPDPDANPERCVVVERDRTIYCYPHLTEKLRAELRLVS